MESHGPPHPAGNKAAGIGKGKENRPRGSRNVLNGGKNGSTAAILERGKLFLSTLILGCGEEMTGNREYAQKYVKTGFADGRIVEANC